MAEAPRPPPAACPICGRPAQERLQPFCSVRCADADLGRWLTGQYRVPGPSGDEVEPGPADGGDLA